VVGRWQWGNATKIDLPRAVCDTGSIAASLFLTWLLMHVIVIGWIYVVLMISVVSDSLLKGVIRFLFLGAFPVGLWMWMSFRKAKRRREDVSQASHTPSDET
jgi:hypothetical protein